VTPTSYLGQNNIFWNPGLIRSRGDLPK
jgi:hypothetical protein